MKKRNQEKEIFKNSIVIEKRRNTRQNNYRMGN